MAAPLRWGILGASNFALTEMGPAIHAARGNRLAAVATRNAGKADAFAAFAPDIMLVEGYEALLASDEIDAVYIPLPNHLHVDWSLKAVKAGKHVLCEKPMAMRAEEYELLIAARDGSGRVVVEGFMIVHHPQWQTARDLLALGTIGRLRHVEVIFSYNNRDPQNVRNMPGMGGGGLRDIGVYAFGSVRFATGTEPTTLGARLEIEQDFDVYAEITASFPDFGYHAVVSTRMAARQQVIFHGENGVLVLTAPYNAGKFDQAELRIETTGNEVRVLRWPGVKQYVLQVEAFAAAVRGEAPFAWSLEDARGTQVMIDAALRGDPTLTPLG